MLRGSDPARETVVLLAGGRATRLPGKLERDVDGVPLIVRAYRAFAGLFDVAISVARPFGPRIARQLDCPLIVDRYEGRGPLGGMLSACDALSGEWLYFVAADAPGIVPETLATLRGARRPGDEAVLPEHDGFIEPLAALYDRSALLREGLPVLNHGDGAVRSAIARLRAHRVMMPADQFINVNTPADWRRAFASHKDSMSS